MSLAAQGICLSCSGAVEVLELSLGTGEVVSQASYSAPRSNKLGSSVVLRNSLVAAISSDGQQLCSAKLEGEQTWPEMKFPLHTKSYLCMLYTYIVSCLHCQALPRASADHSCLSASCCHQATSVRRQMC